MVLGFFHPHRFVMFCHIVDPLGVEDVEAHGFPDSPELI